MRPLSAAWTDVDGWMDGVHRWQSEVSVAEEPLGGTGVSSYEQINETKSRYWSPPPNVSVSRRNRLCPVRPRSTRINLLLSSTAHLMKDIMAWVGRRTVSRPFWWTDCKPFIMLQERQQRTLCRNNEPWVHIKRLESLKGYSTDVTCRLRHGKYGCGLPSQERLLKIHNTPDSRFYCEKHRSNVFEWRILKAKGPNISASSAKTRLG